MNIEFLGYCKEVHRPEYAIEILHVGDEPKLPNFRGYGECARCGPGFGYYYRQSLKAVKKELSFICHSTKT